MPLGPRSLTIQGKTYGGAASAFQGAFREGSELAAAPAGRATRIERRVAPEADATRELYERYSGQIFGYCLHRLGSREEAEDAVQSTFLNAFRGLVRGVVPESDSAWLFKIAENVCHSRHRSSWRRGRLESPSDLDAFQDVLPAPPRAQDELIRLGEALQGLPENQRREILLREWQGLSYREIAAELELSQSAVETLIFRARRSLVDGLEAPLPEPRRVLRRASHGLDVGGMVGVLKALFASGAAVKVAAVAVAVTSATVAGHRHHGIHLALPAPGPLVRSHVVHRPRPAVARAVATPPAVVAKARPPAVRVAAKRPVAPHRAPAPRVGAAAKPTVAPVVAAPKPPRELTAQTPPPTPAAAPTLEQDVPPVVPAAKPKPAPAPQPAHEPTTTTTAETQPALTNEVPPPTQTVDGSGG